MIQTSRRKVLRPWNGKFEGEVQPLKGASDREELSVSLKRYLIRNLSSSGYIANPKLLSPQVAAELGLDSRGRLSYTSATGRSRPFLLLSIACSDIFC